MDLPTVILNSNVSDSPRRGGGGATVGPVPHRHYHCLIFPFVDIFHRQRWGGLTRGLRQIPSPQRRGSARRPRCCQSDATDPPLFSRRRQAAVFDPAYERTYPHHGLKHPPPPHLPPQTVPFRPFGFYLPSTWP